ncbi:MAG: VOC family protein [Candidatus Hodarchaeota archaeon]
MSNDLKLGDLNVYQLGYVYMPGAFAQYNATQLELIQLIEGDCIYKEFLDQGREGLNHILYLVNDLKAVINKYKEDGIEVI